MPEDRCLDFLAAKCGDFVAIARTSDTLVDWWVGRIITRVGNSKDKSANTLFQIVDIDNGQRLLIGTNNKFYYSDNECITLVESNGLGNSNIKRFIVQAGTNHIYALVNDSPRAIYRSTDLGENTTIANGLI